MNSETIIEKLLSLDTDQMIQYIEIDLGYRNKTVDSRKEILDSLRGIDSDSLIFIEARLENLQKQFDHTKHLPWILAIWNIAIGLYQTLIKSYPLLNTLLVAGATLAFWWAYYKDRKKLLAVNYLSDLLGRIKTKKE
ncbi:hypothetical protein NHM07_07825 [Bacillus subtilis]|uniref:hypothetical protein n=1 Tax=Bacillus subtilis TaxID=1423 RepID=UPI000C78A182|nr:hypothetical protein [Bacillus subtilis]MCO8148471.1 hypothetical protein [Bacillus subtilis]MCR1991116.1 hypothetical protein [Bacillus subtilis]MDQ4710898.1 hypothetical protein [Bacillus subtilis]MEC2179913.1 hypothetical protein [Bacillus subtilis]PLV32513.1 hypothetical protein BSP4_34940 [Bacillus subtilis subsp. subtilis]